jgi:hypothetical protein
MLAFPDFSYSNVSRRRVSPNKKGKLFVTKTPITKELKKANEQMSYNNSYNFVAIHNLQEKLSNILRYFDREGFFIRIQNS